MDLIETGGKKKLAITFDVAMGVHEAKGKE